ncbi:MAG: ParB/RepB/Spo0J family partition protein [Patescibacteria group bacterium]
MMFNKRQSGLGRGLGALIPPKTNAPANDFELEEPIISDIPPHATGPEAIESRNMIRMIPVEKIIPNSHQPREYFDHAGLEDLVSSIKQHGIIQPLVVAPLPDGRYELIAGERRLRAAVIAELLTVPAVIRSATEQEKLELAIIENVQRKDLNAMEEAKAYVRLRDEFNLTQDQIGERVGKSRPQVGNTIRLLELEPEIQAALMQGKISQSNARTLLSIPDLDQRMQMFRAMLDGNFTVRDAEARIPISKRRAKNFDPNLMDIESKLRVAYGTKVQIKRNPNGQGEVKIFFQNDEDLRRIVDKANGGELII